METEGIQDKIWSRGLRIRSYDVDFTKRATMEALSRYFLDAAWRHAELLGVGYRALASVGKLWVLSRLLMRVDRYPAWDEPAHIYTWPAPARLALAMRHFEIVDAGGFRLAAGVSAWLVLDVKTRRPQRLEKLLSGVGSLPERRALSEDPQKLPLFRPLSSGQDRIVQYSDVDANGHLNSARFLSWLVDTHPVEFHRNREACRVEINFVGEGLAGESLAVCGQEIAPGECGYGIWRREGEEICRARLQWRARQADSFRRDAQN